MSDLIFTSHTMGDLSVECPKEPPPPHLCCPLEHLHAVVEVEIHLTSHLDLQGKKGSHGNQGCV